MNNTDRKLMSTELRTKENTDTMKYYLNSSTKFSDFESILIIKENYFNK